jgi:hypothetical protein
MRAAFFFGLASILIGALAERGQAQPTRTPSTFDADLLRKFILNPAGSSNFFNLSQLPGITQQRMAPAQQPWTSTFIPAVLGYAAAPYHSLSGVDVFFGLAGFDFQYNQFENTRRPEYPRFRHTLTEDELKTLAPAEKYDLLTGMIGESQSLSTQLWNQAQQRNNIRSLTSWTGMCNGWAPASISVARPTRTVYVPSFDGRFQIPFYPEDIKQLFSTLYFNNASIESDSTPESWNTLGKMPILGARCNRSLRRDGRGYIPDPECNDILPAYWHLIIVHLIGLQKQSFVADINGADPVSNYPIKGYQYSTFNPRTGEEGPLAASLVQLRNFPEDLYSNRRSRRATQLVGIKMRVDYVGFHFSNTATEDSPERDSLHHLDLIYDLELTQDGEIVGGIWRSNAANIEHPIFGIRGNPNHPDFVWYPPKGITRNSVAILPSAGTYRSERIGYTGEYDEQATGTWIPRSPMPQNWKTPAQAAVQVQVPVQEGTRLVHQIRPQPLAKVLYALLDQSRQNEPSPTAESPRASIEILSHIGLLGRNARCQEGLTLPAPSGLEFTLPLVAEGERLQFEARVRIRPLQSGGGQWELVTDGLDTRDRQRVRVMSRERKTLELRPGETRDVSTGFWYGEGFGPTYFGLTVRVKVPATLTLPNQTQAPAAQIQYRRVENCGQLFLEQTQF